MGGVIQELQEGKVRVVKEKVLLKENIYIEYKSYSIMRIMEVIFMRRIFFVYIKGLRFQYKSMFFLVGQREREIM